MDAYYLAKFLLTTVFLALSCLYWYFKKKYEYWEKRNIPYLKPLIPFGNILKVYTKKCNIGERFAEIYFELKKMGVKHGGAYALNAPVYIPVDPNIIKHIMVNDANNYFINHGYFQDSEIDPLSAHLFNMEGNQWKHVRTKITQAYTLSKLKKMFLTMVDLSKEFEKHLEVCTEKFPDGLNIKIEIMKVNTDIMMKTSYGMEANTLKGDNEELLKQLDNFIVDQWTLYKNSMVFLFPKIILRILNFRLFPKESNEFVRRTFMGLMQYRKKFKVQRDDLADILLNLCERDENKKDHTVQKGMEPLTENEFIAQVWVFIGAGAESSATTVSFALYELSKRPDYQRKLRDDIKNVLAKYDNQLTFDALKEMNYLDYVVNETLRLYPILPILLRLCGSEYKVPGTDYVMEKNTLAIIPNYGLQRDPEYFPDPATFNPERFTTENKAKRPFISFMPFGEGPRICPGKKFGLLQTKVGLLTIIKNYEVSLSDKTEAGIEFAPWELGLRKKGDIWVKLKKITEL